MSNKKYFITPTSGKRSDETRKKQSENTKRSWEKAEIDGKKAKRLEQLAFARSKRVYGPQSPETKAKISKSKKKKGHGATDQGNLV